MIDCLRTRVRKQPIIVLYFEIDNELKFYNLKPRSNSNFTILTPTFSRDGFYNSCFQNPSENSDIDNWLWSKL